MEKIALEAAKRAEAGKVSARKSREKGVVPAVIYGKKMKTISLSVKVQALEKALAHGAAHKIVNLHIGNEEKLCLIHEIQKDVFGKRVLHVDFHHISMEEKITAKVPVELKGEPAGAKDGGILDHVLWEVEVKALPANLPEKLEVSVAGLAINQSVQVKDISVPQGVEILEDSEEIVAVVHPPRAEEIPVAAPAAEGAAGAVAATPAQPEVIAKGKKEEEGAEEAPAPAKPEKSEKAKK